MHDTTICQLTDVMDVTQGREGYLFLSPPNLCLCFVRNAVPFLLSKLYNLDVCRDVLQQCRDNNMKG